MNILITSPTAMELDPIKKNFRSSQYDNIFFLVSGVGVVTTAFHVTKFITSHNIDLVIQVGICGSYDKMIGLGSIFKIQSDVLIDSGEQNHNSPLSSLREMNLLSLNNQTDTKDMIENKFDIFKRIDLPITKGATVSMMSYVKKKFKTQKIEQFDLKIETLEGYAFHFVCDQMKIPYIQIRAVSNFVFNSDRKHWNINEAIDVYSKFLKKILSNDIPLWL